MALVGSQVDSSLPGIGDLLHGFSGQKLRDFFKIGFVFGVIIFLPGGDDVGGCLSPYHRLIHIHVQFNQLLDGADAIAGVKALVPQAEDIAVVMDGYGEVQPCIFAQIQHMGFTVGYQGIVQDIRYLPQFVLIVRVKLREQFFRHVQRDAQSILAVPVEITKDIAGDLA